MDAILTKETTETKKRVAVLSEETRLEQLRKDELDLKRELLKLERPSLIELIKRLFRKGGNKNGQC